MVYFMIRILNHTLFIYIFVGVKIYINMRIKEVLKEKGMTAKELAVKIGVTPPSISVAINGNMTIEMLNRIADALGVPVTDLFEQPASDTITCPKCGAKLEIKAKE
jgi:transcriptional regulator with XRE-family HTH domain